MVCGLWFVVCGLEFGVNLHKLRNDPCSSVTVEEEAAALVMTSGMGKSVDDDDDDDCDAAPVSDAADSTLMLTSTNCRIVPK